MFFNKSVVPTPVIHGKDLGKIAFLLGHFPAIFVVFGTILSFRVTLVTAKNNIAVGMRARTRVHVYTRTHIRNSCVRAQGGRRMSVRYGQAVNQKRNTPTICNIDLAESQLIKIKMSLFCDFFPLWGNIDPYTYRGASSQRKARSTYPKCVPTFHFYFHGVMPTQYIFT